MTPSNLETKHSELVDQLEALNIKLDQFINGDASVTINTDGGTIKSLAGIVQDLYTVRALQKIVDHRLLTEAQADATITDGMLVRVWGDTAEINGIYKAVTGSLTKISYADLYDLTS
jgi:hypothetical protein